MEAGNQQQVAMVLKEFKTNLGEPNFPVLYNIPNSQRIRDLAKQDYPRIRTLISAALTVFFEGMNFKRGMNGLQIVTLVDVIIEGANEDNLALEDLMLFLQNMLSGKYEMTYESMDIPKFMRVFEIYRQERWSQWIKFKEDEHEQYKSFDRLNLEPSKGTVLGELLNDYSKKMQAKNDEIRELRAERKRQHDIDNF